MKISSGHFINFDLTKSICENSTIDPLTGIEPVVLRFRCSALHDLAVKLVDNWTLQLRWSEYCTYRRFDSCQRAYSSISRSCSRLLLKGIKFTLEPIRCALTNQMLFIFRLTNQMRLIYPVNQSDAY